MIDPFLYPGAAVDLTADELRAEVRLARVIAISRTPQNAGDGGMAWCLTWPKIRRRKPTLKLLPVSVLRLSDNATEPPPLPRWANPDAGEPAWRTWQRELNQTLDLVIGSVRGQPWSTL